MVAVSALTTLMTPWMIRSSGRVASYVDRRLPHAFQTYAALYGSWLQALRSAPDHANAWARIRRLVGLMGLDVALFAAIVIASSLSMEHLLRVASGVFHVQPGIAAVLIVGTTGVLLIPFVLGAIRIARALGVALAAEALPAPARTVGGLDLAAAPRRALLVTLQIGILLVSGIPVVALTQPFLPGFEGMGVLLVGLALLIVPLWRSATNLQGHVRAGAQVILETLAAQSATTQVTMPAMTQQTVATTVKTLLPGLGNARAVRLISASPAVGQTLKQINLRGLTGATVIAIDRKEGDVVYPTGDEMLRDGDTLVLTGTSQAVDAARELLRDPDA
jgi:CPA2 family monovalent cation:H+ antiporter-2